MHWIDFLLNLNIVIDEKKDNKNKDIQDNNEQFKDSSVPKTGRNEKCPCGSGKKFKHCHGNI